MEKLSAEELVWDQSHILIRVVKLIDEKVISIKALKNWQKLKVHGMSLVQYLEKRKMELFSQKIELFTGIQLKMLSRWLINEAWLKKHLEFETRKGSGIVITVKNNIKASTLCSKRLRLGGVLKVVEKYWEAGTILVCMGCTDVNHD